MDRIISTLLLSVGLACAASAQSSRTVQAAADGTIVAPANFFSANGVPSLSAEQTWTGNQTFGGGVTLGGLSLAGTLNVTDGQVTFGPNNYGWSYNPDLTGQMECNFPSGTVAFYESGDPPVPTMNFPGTIQTDELVCAKISTNSWPLVIAPPADQLVVNMPAILSWKPEATFTSAQNEAITAIQKGIAVMPAVGTTDGQTINYYPRMIWKTLSRDGVGYPKASFPEWQWRTLTEIQADQGRATGTASLNFPSIAAGAAASLTLTVTGATAAATPSVALGWSAALPSGIVVQQAYVSADNTVTVTLANISAAPIDPAAVTCRASIFNF